MCHCAGRSLARVCPQARPDSVCAETLRGWVWVPTCPAEQGTRGSCREGGTKGRRHGRGVPAPSNSEGFAARPAPCTPFFPGSQPRVQRAQQPCHQRRLPLRRQPPHLHGRQGHEHHAVAGHLVPAGAPGSRAGPDARSLGASAPVTSGPLEKFSQTSGKPCPVPLTPAACSASATSDQQFRFLCCTICKTHLI